MYKFLTFLLLFLFLCGIQAQSYCLEVDFSFDIGLKGGTTQESVYEDETCISRSDWMDKAVPFTNFSGMFRTNNFLFKLNLTLAAPLISGEMEDYDFLIPDNENPSRYAWHTAYLDKDFSCGAEIGYEFLFNYWYITPKIGFQYRSLKWTASDGYLQYPATGQWTGDEQKVYVIGSVASYEQAIWFPYAAVEAGIHYTFPYEGKLQIAVGVGVYPYMWAETNDTHFLRNLQFNNSLSGGLGLNYELTVSFFPEHTNGIGFIIRYKNENILNMKGSATSNETGISSGSLLITEGYGSRIETMQSSYTMGIIIPVYNIGDKS
ncbi:MAG: omptin family outer membrane protease [Treponema sp.]|jgi:outer membrane protease|nr:omptin family outer membrane protease [Treponema sp.]